MAKAEAGTITVKVGVDMLAVQDSVNEMIFNQLREFAEWLARSGQLNSDRGRIRGNDLWTLDNLVADFLRD